MIIPITDTLNVRKKSIPQAKFLELVKRLVNIQFSVLLTNND